MKTLALYLAASLLAVPAAAQPAGEMDYAPGSLGYDALIRGDLAKAEIQLRSDRTVDANDPARLLNLGQVLARTGRIAEAADVFRRAKAMEDGELVLADGSAISSREAARRALRSLPEARFSSR